MTAWLCLLLAGALEIAWAVGLKQSDDFTRFWPSLATVLAIALSFSLLAVSLKSVPFGTAYAVWTGIGAAGTVIVGIVAFPGAGRCSTHRLRDHDRCRHNRAQACDPILTDVMAVSPNHHTNHRWERDSRIFECDA